MNDFNDYNLSFVEKTALKEYLRLKIKNQEIIILGSQDMASVLDVSRPRAHTILMNLRKKKILKKLDRKGFMLTSEGEDLVNELCHREKLLEGLFHLNLKMPLEKAKIEAENLSIYVSTDLVLSICKTLDIPVQCPHGIDIPHLHLAKSTLED